MSNLKEIVGNYALSFIGKVARAYHFSTTTPLGVRPRINRRPLPTSPKFAAVATARRESKYGEYLTA